MTATIADDERIKSSAAADNVKAQTQLTSLSNSLDAEEKLLTEKDKVVEDLRPRVATLLTHNSVLSRANNDLQNQLRSRELAVSKLQEQIASNDSAKPGAAAPGVENGVQVTSLSAGNQTPVQINGTVTRC